jgi:hypothetical protein
MTQPFADTTDAGPLIEAYELADDPKPSLERILRLIRAGAIQATRREDGVWMVPSVVVFNDELNDWKRRTSWSDIAIWNVLPPGHVTIVSYCRDHVAPDIGRQKRLLTAESPAQLTAYARSFIAAGDCTGAQSVHAGVWAATPADIKAWLHRRFGIFVR